MARYLDYSGLTHYDEKIKEKIDTKLTASADSFTGADGVTITSENSKIKISGSGCVQKITNSTATRQVVTIEPNSDTYTVRPVSIGLITGSVAQRNDKGEIAASVSTAPTNNTLLNKKYCDDNFCKLPSELVKNTDEYQKFITAQDSNNNQVKLQIYGSSPYAGTIPLRRSNGEIRVGAPINGTDATNKTYVDNAIADLFSLDGDVLTITLAQ